MSRNSQSKGFSYTKTELPRHEFMEQVLGRLENEVGYYLKLLAKNPMMKDGKQVGVGFFSVVRLLAPVIETLGRIDKLSPQEFLEQKLKIKKPYMTWTMFRDGLAHNENGPIVMLYSDKQVTWHLLLDLSNTPATHSTGPDHILLDLLRLYEDLKQYVTQEAKKTDAGNVKIVTAIKLEDGSSNKEVNAIIAELGDNKTIYGFRKVDD